MAPDSRRTTPWQVTAIPLQLAATSSLPRGPGAPHAPSVLSTLNPDGTRRWLSPRPSPGRFLTARRIVAWFLILLFTVTPYAKFGDHPLAQLDLAARRLHFFGMTFFPTDTLLLALLMVGIFLTIFLLTALFGRVWCGWACPQTVYLEFIYRPIERFFEGSPGRIQRGFLASSGWGRILKHAAFLLVSIYVAHTFLAWFVGVETLWAWMQHSPLEHPAGFLVMLTVTGLMMLDFCWFREQTCIVACPYGRLQSALLDRHSLIVTYDRNRGEPRGKARRSAPADMPLPVVGDCVDCVKCVTTCPTGIDIRNGLQMECVGCAQCIDACDAVMEKLHRPRGLIRYSSQVAIEGGHRRFLRARVILYPALLAVVFGAFAVGLSRRGPAYVTVLRGLGRPFMEQADGRVTNPVRVKITNRTNTPARYLISAAGVPDAEIVAELNPVEVAPSQAVSTPVTIAVPAAAFESGRCEITLRVEGPDGWARELKYRLMGPTTPHRSSPGGTP